MLTPNAALVEGNVVFLDQTTVAEEPSLVAEDLVYSIDGRPLVKGVNLSLSARGVTTLMGPNGAGKSLLVRLLHGLLEPQSGTIKWHGEPLNAAVRAKQAMVFQKPVLLRRSVSANMDFAIKVSRKLSKGEREAEAERLLTSVGLMRKYRQPAHSLSGGEKQRLALARALATDPKVLFLDEPTANLDPASTKLIEDAVLDAADQGVKAIMITHDAGQARRLGGETVFMARGRITEVTPSDDFAAAPVSAEARAYLNGELVI